MGSSAKGKKASRGAAARSKRESQAIGDLVAWVSVPLSSTAADSNLLGKARPGPASAPLFDLHTHSTFSDGRLTPSELVARAHATGVQVLALTDHDTMAGVPVAMEAGLKLGVRVIPGVEISGLHQGSEPVHILAYYGPCGPAKVTELNAVLHGIREGRFLRAQSMVQKLRALGKEIGWERVLAIAGEGVAPGRVHVARALVDAGHVATEQEAFVTYLHDGGPAYAEGAEPPANEVVRLIRCTGGVAVLAHPWSLKNSFAVIRSLKSAGLHGMEVYRGSGRSDGFGALCEAYELFKLGGSDFHGRGDPNETQLGGVSLPALVLQRFLKTAEPIWRAALKDILHDFADDSKEASAVELAKSVSSFAEFDGVKTTALRNAAGSRLRVSPWLTGKELTWVQEEAALLQLLADTGHENPSGTQNQ